MDRLYLTERGSGSESDPVRLVAGVAPILAAGRAPLVAFEGDIENFAIPLPALPIVVVEGLQGEGNISYIIFPTLMEVPWLTEPDLRIEDGLGVGGMEGCLGIGGRAENEL